MHHKIVLVVVVIVVIIVVIMVVVVVLVLFVMVMILVLIIIMMMVLVKHFAPILELRHAFQSSILCQLDLKKRWAVSAPHLQAEPAPRSLSAD